MFGGNSNSGAKGGDSVVDTLIGRQTEILGDVRFTGGLHVDGKIKGKVLAESGNKGASLSVSENGSVEGDIRVPSIVLNGRVTGDVYASERVHLASKGCPCLGDPVYGSGPPAPAVRQAIAEAGLTRQALHAAVLGFRHPVTGEPLRFESPLPEDMARLEALLAEL